MPRPLPTRPADPRARATSNAIARHTTRTNLTAARDALRVVDATQVSPRNQVELTLGLGQWLFLNERYGPAAELFDAALGRDEALPAGSRKTDAGLVGDVRRSPRADDPASPRPSSTSASSIGWTPSCARPGIDRGRLLAGGGRAIDGRARPRVDVCDGRMVARARHGRITAPRFGPTSIASCRPAIIPERARADGGPATRHARRRGRDEHRVGAIQEPVEVTATADPDYHRGARLHSHYSLRTSSVPPRPDRRRAQNQRAAAERPRSRPLAVDHPGPDRIQHGLEQAGAARPPAPARRGSPFERHAYARPI